MHKDTDFQVLFGNLKIGVLRVTPGLNGHILFANQAFRTMLRLTAKSLVRQKFSTLFVDREQYRTIDRKIRAQGLTKDEEVRLKKTKTDILWCSLTAAVVKDKGGKVKYFDVLLEDISTQKIVEKELIQSKKLFQIVFEKSAVAITVTDQHEKIMAWNPFAETMLEMTKEDLFNKPVKDLYPAKEWKKMRSLRIRQKGMLSDITTQVYKKDGSRLDVNMSISVLKDTEGRVTGAIGIMNDITNQKVAERKIKESENKIRVILDNSAAAITLTDHQERIVTWNSFTEKLLGMKKRDLYLKPVSELYPAAEWRKIRAQNIRKTGSKHHLETRITRKDGKAVDIDLSVNVLRDVNGNIIGSVGIMQDITEQKRFQHVLLQAKLAAEEASSAKSLFLANMSHEVRTPMNTILGMIDLTLDTNLNNEQRDNLKVAKDAADNLLGLLNDILDLSRVEAGKITLEKIDFHLLNVVSSVVKGLSVLARNKSLELTLDIHPQVPEVILGDPVRLRQVLVNLINNAIKFTHKGKIATSIKVSSLNKNECQLLFAVADEGIGIPKDKQEAIFNVFTQADDSTTRRFGGTGLGLAISQKLVEMMQGRIWVESEECKGSTFYFTATFQVLHQKAPAMGKEETGGLPARYVPNSDLKDLNVLLAEDHIINQKIVTKMLEKRGWKVVVAQNGQEVLDFMQKEDFDLILMDNQMPVLDGLETTRVIREEEKKTGKHIPIIALTARAMQEDKKRCLDAGMDGYVSKPIDRLKLFETIEGLCKKEG